MAPLTAVTRPDSSKTLALHKSCACLLTYLLTSNCGNTHPVTLNNNNYSTKNRPTHSLGRSFGPSLLSLIIVSILAYWLCKSIQIDLQQRG